MVGINLHLTTATTKDTTRDGFGIGLKELAALNPKVVGLCADLTESTRMHWFDQAFPERYIEMGVAEENMIGVAAGLALAGKIPFAASYACFSPANSWGVVRSSVCYSNLPVIVVGGHAGLATGADGATHQSLEDIALMRVLPNMTVVVPCDKEEARKATIAMADLGGPAYLRVSKAPTPTITTAKTPFTIGTAMLLQPGEDLALVACGPMVAVAQAAAQHLKTKHISVAVVNMHTIKPLDTNMLAELSKKVKAFITLEDHQVSGGLGSAVAEYLAEQPNHPPLYRMGVADSFGQSGTPEELYAAHGMTAQDVVRTALAALR